MQYASIPALALALVGLSQASPIFSSHVERQTPVTCSTTSTGYLAVRPNDKILDGPTTYVGVVSGVRHNGIDGQQDSILVTRDNKGDPLAPQMWEFATCSSDNGHAPPYNYEPIEGQGTPRNSFGIIRPAGATQHCLALESTLDGKGQTNSVLDSNCAQIPEQYRLWMNSEYSTTTTQPLYFANGAMTVLVSDTAHKELTFTNVASNPSSQPMQLLLLPTY